MTGTLYGTEHMSIAADKNVYLLANYETSENHCAFTFGGVPSVGNASFGLKASNNSAVNIDTSSNNGATGTVTNIGNIMLTDKNGITVGQFGTEANGNQGRIRTYFSVHNKKTDGTSIGGYFCMDANKDGTISYSVENPTAFRKAILAVQDAPGMSTNMEIPASSLTNQLALLKFKCQNSGATTYNNHVLTTIFSDGGLSLFDSTAAKMLWEFNYAHALVYKGAFPYTDFNNYTVPTGIYHLDGTTRTNGPSQGYTWSHMIVIAESTWQTQIIIAGYNMYIRKRTGSPATWANWTTLA